MWRPSLLLFFPVFLAAQSPLRFGSDLQLFVDDYLIESMKGTRLWLHHPIPAGKAIAFDEPWEGNVSAYVTVFRDGPKVRMYYRGVNDPAYVKASALQPGEMKHAKNDEVVCYAESPDGIAWTKPKLGIFDFRGSKANNILMAGDARHNFAPFKDPNPAAPPAARYKGLGGARKLWAYQSADGIHWTKTREEPVITDGAFDSQNLAFWDSKRGEYVAIYRDFLQGVRTIKCARSKDFLTWTAGEWADYGKAPAEQLYTNATQPYFRAPQIYLAFPKRYVPSRFVNQGVTDRGVSEAVFMTSRDGVHWNRFLEAFIRPGRDPRDWVHRNRMTAAGLIPTAEDEISLYVSRHYNFPSAYLERLTIRTDGFVSLHADYSGGTMTTRPFFIEGNRMALNYATSAAGSIRWEILDINGNPLSGFSTEETKLLCGDQIAEVIELQRRRTGERGLGSRPVRLRFHLKDADLYSLQFLE